MQLVTQAGLAVLGRETLPSGRGKEEEEEKKEKKEEEEEEACGSCLWEGGDPPWVQDTQQDLKDPLNKDSLGKCLLPHADPRRAPHWALTST